MIQFDPKTYQDWKIRDIHDISIELVASGCEGTSIRIYENTILENTVPGETEYHSTRVYVREKDIPVLQDAYITHTGNKWILKSAQVLTRCGCGKSFGIKTGDAKNDKIQLLRSKLAKNKGIHH